LANGEISGELETFIHRNVNSIEQLEILLLLFGDGAHSWTPGEIAQRLYIQPDSAKARLTDLESKRLCHCTDQAEEKYRFAPDDPDNQRMVQELMEAYRVRRVAVISLVFSKTPDPINSFSDAFRIRKKD
jgi:hypothetical protein